MNKRLETIIEKTKDAYHTAKSKVAKGAAITLIPLTLASCNPNSMKTAEYLVELPGGGNVLVEYQLKDRGMFGYKEITTMRDGDEKLTFKQKKGIGKKNRKEKLISKTGRDKVIYTNNPIHNNIVEKIRADGQTYRYDDPGLADHFKERTVFYDRAKADMLAAKDAVKDKNTRYVIKQMRENLESALNYD